jgi:hypothetical protein
MRRTIAWLAVMVGLGVGMLAPSTASAALFDFTGGDCGAVGPPDAMFAIRMFSTNPIPRPNHPSRLGRIEIANQCNAYVYIELEQPNTAPVWILVDPHTAGTVSKRRLKKVGLYKYPVFGDGVGCCGASPADFPFADFTVEILPDGRAVAFSA